MADVNFWIPSQSGSYNLPSGDTLRVKIHYDDTSGSDTDMDSEIIDVSSLKMPFETEPSSQQIRLASMTFTFSNDSNDWESTSVLNSNKRTETYISVYLNGSLWWKGLVDFDLVKKDEYYLDSGSLKYREIRIKAFDAINYFWVNDVDLSDVSYSDRMSLKTLFENIFSEIGFSSGDVVLDDNLSYTEGHGGTLDWDDWKIQDQTSSQQVSAWLKSWMIKTCTFVYNYNGKVYVVLRSYGTTQAINSKDILDGTEIVKNTDPIEYIDYTVTIDTDHGDFENGLYQTGDIDIQSTYGTQNPVDSDRNLTIDGTGIVDMIITTASGNQNHPSAGYNTADATTHTTTVMYDSAPNDFHTALVEVGDQNEYEKSSGVYTTALINLVAQTQIQFYSRGAAPISSANYKIWRGDQTNRSRRKAPALEPIISGAYDEYYLTNRNLLKLGLVDVSNFLNLHYRFTFDGSKYRIKEAEINLQDDEVEFILREVA